MSLQKPSTCHVRNTAINSLMNLVITAEQRFDRTPDGIVWTVQQYPYSFWLRYLKVFDEVRVVARVRDVATVPAQHIRSSGLGVTFIAIPYYRGPAQFLSVARKARRVAKGAVEIPDAVILRIPSIIAWLVESVLNQTQHPFGVEVIGDPYDVFAPGVVEHQLQPFLRWWFTRIQKRQCKNAVGAAYVTKTVLQQRYPCRATQVGISDVEINEIALLKHSHAMMTRYSSVEFSPADFMNIPRSAVRSSRRIRLITVSSLEQLYKAPDVLMRAVALCVADGLNLEVVIVGDGKFRPKMESLAQKLGISDRACFRGMLPSSAAVRAELDAADIFVLPSRTEGLPRALIEAMARALPCIGSEVGGIPELLTPEDMVPANDSLALAKKIRAIIEDPQRMAQMSYRNYQTAKEYSNPVLQESRRKYYMYIKEKTETWLKSRGQ
jgi:glycosyltransferase involved in cell wall biosynthesis